MLSENEVSGVKVVADLMAVSARTAPKTKGVDAIEVKVLSDKKIFKKIADVMQELAVERGKKGFSRDAINLLDSDMLVLIGALKGSSGLNCSGCGWKNCEEFEKTQKLDGDYRGPNCIFRMMDLGIAVCSAIKVASELNVDNRVMYHLGVAVVRLRLMESNIVIGIPLSVKGKNIYFDRT